MTAVPPLCSMTRAFGSKGKISPCSLPVISPCTVWIVTAQMEFAKRWNLFAENGSICDNGGGSSKRQENKTLLCGLKRSNPGIKRVYSTTSTLFPDTVPGCKKTVQSTDFWSNMRKNEPVGYPTGSFCYLIKLHNYLQQHRTSLNLQW